jgi:acyl-CoA hydrolase
MSAQERVDILQERVDILDELGRIGNLIKLGAWAIGAVGMLVVSVTVWVITKDFKDREQDTRLDAITKEVALRGEWKDETTKSQIRIEENQKRVMIDLAEMRTEIKDIAKAIR